jgi:hypothetical protein
MTETDVIDFIQGLKGVETVTHTGGIFFFVGAERMLPMITLALNDTWDAASNLELSGAYRLNIGVTKKTFSDLFREETGFDFTAYDVLMPHPIYGAQYWVCILNPSAATFEHTVKPLIEECYQRAVEVAARRDARKNAG